MTGNERSFKSIVTAAESLASRYDERVRAIRSWDKSFSKRYSITNMEENFLVIIDSMCSMHLPLHEKYPSSSSTPTRSKKNPLAAPILSSFLCFAFSDMLTLCLDLDLLFYAGHHTQTQRYIDIATAHAHAVAKAIIRPDGSSFHVCNFNPKTGDIQKQYTHQGYKDDSTWSRCVSVFTYPVCAKV